jgi:hypothetical protein
MKLSFKKKSLLFISIYSFFVNFNNKAFSGIAVPGVIGSFCALLELEMGLLKADFKFAKWIEKKFGIGILSKSINNAMNEVFINFIGSNIGSSMCRKCLGGNACNGRFISAFISALNPTMVIKKYIENKKEISEEIKNNENILNSVVASISKIMVDVLYKRVIKGCSMISDPIAIDIADPLKTFIGYFIYELIKSKNKTDQEEMMSGLLDNILQSAYNLSNFVRPPLLA